MTTWRRMVASLAMTLRRLRASALISAGVVVAMAALIGIWVGIPLYAESASARQLSVEVDDAADDGVPFGYLLSYNRLSGGNRSWDDFVPLNQLVDGDNTPFGSTVRAQRRVVSTIPFDLVLPADASADALVPASVIDRLSFASSTHLDESVAIVQGRLPEPSVSTARPVEVLIDERQAADLGVTTGQQLTVVNQRIAPGESGRSFDVVVTGVWRAPNRTDAGIQTTTLPEDRFATNGTLAGTLLVPEATISQAIDPLSDDMLSNAQWLILLASDRVTTDQVDQLLDRTTQINRQIDDRLRGARVLVSPETSLAGFQEQVADLNRGLSAFSWPTIALVLAVVGLLASMRWNQRAAEITMLRRRGVAASQIIAESIFEAVVLGAVASALGLVVARFVATFMARTVTFMQLGQGVELGLVMNDRSWSALAVAAVVAIALVAAPSFGALRQAALTPPRTADGKTRLPWWQRSYLDIAIIVAIAFFSWWLLRRQTVRGDLLRDPIVILLPALNVIAAGLVAVRVIPWLSGMLARVFERSNNTAALLVFRRAERNRGATIAPILLLIMTGALAVYTGSLAKTLDLQLLDAAHHRVGAQNSISDDAQTPNRRFDVVDGESVAVEVSDPVADPQAYSRIWGVDRVSRLAKLPARLSPASGSDVAITFAGIDTASFGDVAFWRDDYAGQTLPNLIARLQGTPDSLLVSTEVANQARLRLGDIVTVGVRDGQRRISVDLVIVGSFRQFPTWIPGEDLPLAVASLSDFEARAGANIGRAVLFETNEQVADTAQTRADFTRLGISTSPPQSPDELIERAQTRPERQGVFGLLTVSFVLSATLTILGFVFYAVFGFTEQLTEVGVLRALGLRLRSLMVLVGLDLLLVAAVGIGVATVTGLAMSRWYLPRLVVNPSGSAPRMLEEIDWSAALGIPLALAATLLTATALLLLVLRRIKLFSAIKLGSS